MTPRIDLRVNANQHILDANALFSSGSHKNACNQAALGVEMMLKARLCRAMNWDKYPSSRDEAKALNEAAGLAKNTELLIHDLDDLMTLNEQNSIFVRDSLHVEWPKVGGWGIEHRYSPNSVISIGDARARIDESTKVVQQLYRYECNQELLDLESEFVRRYGLVYLFAILQDDDGSLSLTISPSASDEKYTDIIAAWIAEYLDGIDPDLTPYSTWRLIDPNSEIAIVCALQFPSAPGVIAYVSGNVFDGFDYIAEGLIFTATRWTEDQVTESLKNATEVDFL